MFCAVEKQHKINIQTQSNTISTLLKNQISSQFKMKTFAFAVTLLSMASAALGAHHACNTFNVYFPSHISIFPPLNLTLLAASLSKSSNFVSETLLSSQLLTNITRTALAPKFAATLSALRVVIGTAEAPMAVFGKLQALLAARQLHKVGAFANSYLPASCVIFSLALRLFAPNRRPGVSL